MRFPHKTARRTILHPSRSRAFLPVTEYTQIGRISNFTAPVSSISSRFAVSKINSPVSLCPPGNSSVSRPLCLQNTHFPSCFAITTAKTQQLVFHIFVKLNRQHKTPPKFSRSLVNRCQKFCSTQTSLLPPLRLPRFNLPQSLLHPYFAALFRRSVILLSGKRIRQALHRGQLSVVSCAYSYPSP